LIDCQIDVSVWFSVSVLCSDGPSSLVHVLVWSFQMVVLLGLLGGFHVYMRLTSGQTHWSSSLWIWHANNKSVKMMMRIWWF